ncbi:hypothetical protein S245_064244 [Arachis hypogaea]
MSVTNLTLVFCCRSSSHHRSALSCRKQHYHCCCLSTEVLDLLLWLRFEVLSPSFISAAIHLLGTAQLQVAVSNVIVVAAFGEGYRSASLASISGFYRRSSPRCRSSARRRSSPHRRKQQR